MCCGSGLRGESSVGGLGGEGIGINKSLTLRICGGGVGRMVEGRAVGERGIIGHDGGEWRFGGNVGGGIGGGIGGGCRVWGVMVWCTRMFT